MNWKPRLLLRAESRAIKRRSYQAAILEALDLDELILEYEEAREWAPRRGLDGHEYFRQRGTPPQSRDERRGEERLGIALVRGEATLSAFDETIDLLTYAFPLITTGRRGGVSEVDLVGHADESNRFWAIELKARGQETPLRALLQVLLYSAILEANHAEIAAELESQHRLIGREKPGMLIAAPESYWRCWEVTPRIGDWWAPYQWVTSALSQRLGTPLETVSLGEIWFQTGDDGWPRLTGTLDCRPVTYPMA